ncbi:MAG TPA: 50S ribosomal protein L18 [Spirochaetota bacterium]|nr:50S ribosomal protein L18 [Spirochaetota bacterium]HOD13505.1 50S ribosomal protein L18 [Spirochaetota bacterium]HPG49831.1 50S ribosomal protein L18 [Spirochaetota bacterium]HPN13499.1 50S ribosomal protein L18 [Spirochaetota bacterium]HQL80632.1 50S ribosomal protein L18 [Spirochaetota bacterium]
MDKIALKKKRITRRRFIIKKKIRMNKDALRLCISKGNRNLYVQIIDDQKQQTLVAMSTLSKEFPVIKNRANKEGAKALGKLFAEKAVKAGIKKVVFDRNGYKYHGRVKAFADAARESGLEF